MSNEERETKKREEGDEEKEESKEMGGKVLSTKTNNYCNQTYTYPLYPTNITATKLTHILLFMCMSSTFPRLTHILF